VTTFIAIQEAVLFMVVLSSSSHRLAAELNRKGAKWDYVISDPTSSVIVKNGTLCVYLKTSKLKKDWQRLFEKKNTHLEIDREPYFVRFNMKTHHCANFHHQK
jgi:hypothetical protein